jgi:hypothetical protein
MTQTIEPVRKEIVVECPQERAFRVFTQRIDAWWPRDYHIGKAEMQTACVEERVGGRIFERGVDGVECPWGEVLVWEPPRRFVWAWQITAQWQYDPAFVTEIEVTFMAEGPQRTRVQLEHRYLERYGDAAEAMRKTMNEGWAPMLAGYASVANG